MSDSVASQSPSSTFRRHNGWTVCGTARKIPGKDCWEAAGLNLTVLWIESQLRWTYFQMQAVVTDYNCLVFFIFTTLRALWIWSLSSVTRHKQMVFGCVTKKSLVIQQTNQYLFNSVIWFKNTTSCSTACSQNGRPHVAQFSSSSADLECRTKKSCLPTRLSTITYSKGPAWCVRPLSRI